MKFIYSVFLLVGILATQSTGVAGKTEPKAAAKKEKAEKAKEEKVKEEKTESAKPRADGLSIEDLVRGKGKEAKLGSRITVHYKGTFQKNGKQFDSSVGGEPISFELNEGQLIKGWTEGIPGMKVGGKRKLKIPYQLAYGESGTPDGAIPPKSDLNFEVELLDVKYE